MADGQWQMGKALGHDCYLLHPTRAEECASRSQNEAAEADPQCLGRNEAAVAATAAIVRRRTRGVHAAKPVQIHRGFEQSPPTERGILLAWEWLHGVFGNEQWRPNSERLQLTAR